MKLTMLGTGNALVTNCYNTCFVISQEKEHFLIDAGGGNTILHQLNQANIPYTDIHHIFVTHKHIDHILGILWMVRVICQSMHQGTYLGDAYIYGHEEVISLIRSMADSLLQKKQTQFIDQRLHLVTVADKEQVNILGRTVTFFDIHSTKAKQFGFCMELDHGETLTCCGDEPYNDTEQVYVENSTWLLHEAFCLAGEADIFHPYEKHHSTVKDACELAEKNKVKHLVLYHTEDKNLEHRRELYLKEGSQYYHGDLLIPYDLETIEL